MYVRTLALTCAKSLGSGSVMSTERWKLRPIVSTHAQWWVINHDAEGEADSERPGATGTQGATLDYIGHIKRGRLEIISER